MKTSRQKVLDYIEAHPVVSASDLSLALKMTQSNARHHIQILYSLGLLEIAGERPTGGKGRPMQLYRLSSQLYGENLQLLTHAVLATMSRQLGEHIYQDSLRAIALALVTATPPGEAAPKRQQASMKLSQRLVQTISKLNQLNYQARWEAHRDGPRIIFGRCPYQAILKQHPELCLMDQYLIEELTLIRAHQISRLTKDASGATYCLFRLVEDDNPKF